MASIPLIDGIVTIEDTNNTPVETVDEQTNTQDIINSDDNREEVILCTATRAELFYLNERGYKVLLDSCGECESCELMFHVSYLHFPDAVEKDSWPIFWKGRYCKDCWSADT